MSLKAREDYRELRVRREMLPYRLPEDNVGRRRAQFSKDERLHLLNIMTQYEPLLDDKNASVFDRREIWRAIERDFHQAGFTRKTSAQLKKYWQNYKYHGRRAQINQVNYYEFFRARSWNEINVNGWLEIRLLNNARLFLDFAFGCLIAAFSFSALDFSVLHS